MEMTKWLQVIEELYNNDIIAYDNYCEIKNAIYNFMNHVRKVDFEKISNIEKIIKNNNGLSPEEKLSKIEYYLDYIN